MSPATIVCIAAAALELGFAVVFVLLARAPGWSRARLYALLAFTAAAYSTVDIAFTLPEVSRRTIEVSSGVNFALGAANATLWTVLAFSRPGRAWWHLGRFGGGLAVTTAGLGAVAAIPGMTSDDPAVAFSVPWLASQYQALTPTGFGTLVGGWIVAALIVVLVRLVRNTRRRGDAAWLNLAAFGVFLTSVLVEVLVTLRTFDFPFTANLGFLVVVVTMLVHAVRRVAADGRRLDELSHDLGAQVERRTRERDLARDALAHAERLAALGQLSASVGHEINNPLTVVRANLELLRAGPGHDGPALIDEALDGAARIARVVADLRAYALPDANRSDLIDLGAVLRAARKLAAHRLRHVATVTEDLGPLPPVRGDPIRLSQVFVNLMVNAGDALDGVVRADPAVTIRARADGGQIRVEIIDNGCGIPAAALARLAEPYFSTRVDRGGTGLGLFVARGLLASVGGSLDYTSEVGVGTTARVTLPAAAPADAAPSPAADATPATPVGATPVDQRPPAQRPSATPVAQRNARRRNARRRNAPRRNARRAPPVDATPNARPAPPTPRRRVVIVDDEPAVARALGRVLASAEVQTFSEARAALAHLRAHREVDVVLCDLMMPGMTGIELYEALAAEAPDVASRLLFITGGAVNPSAAAFLSRPEVRHLAKPVDRLTLLATVDAMATGRASQATAAP
jgi:signal transduction histidine kinase/CheY-like chemotaxis protein